MAWALSCFITSAAKIAPNNLSPFAKSRGVFPCKVRLFISFVIFSGKIRFGVDYCCIILMMSGGLGNIIDRIFRGYVIDYIEVQFMDFAVFNFADILVTCSCFVLAGWLLYEIYQESKKEKAKKKTSSRKKTSLISKAASSTANTIGREIGKKIVRGLFDTFLK